MVVWGCDADGDGGGDDADDDSGDDDDADDDDDHDDDDEQCCAYVGHMRTRQHLGDSNFSYAMMDDSDGAP